MEAARGGEYPRMGQVRATRHPLGRHQDETLTLSSCLISHTHSTQSGPEDTRNAATHSTRACLRSNELPTSGTAPSPSRVGSPVTRRARLSHPQHLGRAVGSRKKAVSSGCEAGLQPAPRQNKQHAICGQARRGVVLSSTDRAETVYD